jgi:hypothetical protein
MAVLFVFESMLCPARASWAGEADHGVTASELLASIDGSTADGGTGLMMISLSVDCAHDYWDNDDDDRGAKNLERLPVVNSKMVPLPLLTWAAALQC